MSEDKLEPGSELQPENSSGQEIKKEDLQKAAADLTKKPDMPVQQDLAEQSKKQSEAQKENVPFNELLLKENEDTEGENPDYDPALLEKLHAEMQVLLAKNRLSNLILIGLIVLYVLALFFFNNWIMILILIIPMLALAVWDHRNLKAIRALQQQINIQQGKSAADLSRYRSLNELPKVYTVVDETETEGLHFDHLVLSPYGIDCISPEDESEQIAEKLNVPQKDVYWISSELPLEEQIEKILSHHENVLSEQELFQILYVINGLGNE